MCDNLKHPLEESPSLERLSKAARIEDEEEEEEAAVPPSRS